MKSLPEGDVDAAFSVGIGVRVAAWVGGALIVGEASVVGGVVDVVGVQETTRMDNKNNARVRFISSSLISDCPTLRVKNEINVDLRCSCGVSDEGGSPGT